MLLVDARAMMLLLLLSAICHKTLPRFIATSRRRRFTRLMPAARLPRRARFCQLSY